MNTAYAHIPDEDFFQRSSYDLCFIQCPKCQSLELHIAGQPKPQVFDDPATGGVMRVLAFGVICCACGDVRRVVE